MGEDHVRSSLPGVRSSIRALRWARCQREGGKGRGCRCRGPPVMGWSERRRGVCGGRKAGVSPSACLAILPICAMSNTSTYRYFPRTRPSPLPTITGTSRALPHSHSLSAPSTPLAEVSHKENRCRKGGKGEGKGGPVVSVTRRHW